MTTVLNITFANHGYCSAEGFLPIAAGGGRTDIQCDDEGDNIASKNKVYGELTAVYWAWKNLKNVDIIGMSHYRRYLMPRRGWLCGLMPWTKTFYDVSWAWFTSSRYSLRPFEQLLQSGRYDIIFAKRWHFDGLTVRQQFLQHHPYPEDLDLARQVLLSHHPEAVAEWDAFMQGSDAYCCCLFVCSWTQFDHLCRWMFPMLFELERCLDMSRYDSYQMRIIAYLYERLLNVYLQSQRLRIFETPFYMIGDGRHKSVVRQDLGAKAWNIWRKLVHNPVR